MPYDMPAYNNRPNDDMVKSFVAELNIVNNDRFCADIPPNLDDGLYDLFRRFMRLHGSGLEIFLTAYLNKFPPSDKQWKHRLNTGMTSLFKLAFEEEVMVMHTLVMMEGLAGRPPVSLSALVKTVYHKDNKNFDRIRSRIRDKYVDAMKHLMMWNVEETARAYKSGTGSTPFYSITIGEAANHYHNLVFVPIMKRHLGRFGSLI